MTPAARRMSSARSSFGAFRRRTRSPCDDGLGLDRACCASGVAKTSTYRSRTMGRLGAVQCIEHRYYVGALIGRMASGGKPDPLLRRAAQGPVAQFVGQGGAMAALRIMHEQAFV